MLFVGLLAVVFSSGCLENAMLLKVNKDGSGTMTYRAFISDDVLAMAAMGDPSGESAAIDPFEDIKKKLAEQFGEAAKLESSRSLKNKKGWEGFEAVYAFDDVNKVSLADIQAGDSGSGVPMEQVGTSYNFTFTPGDVATLKMAPVTMGMDEAEADEAVEEMMDGSGAKMGEMDEMQFGMMKQMLAGTGMRVSFLVFVNGEVVETNSRFQSAKRPNVIALMDISMDKLFEDPQASKLLLAGEDGLDKLADLQIKGVQLESPNREIFISFK